MSVIHDTFCCLRINASDQNCNTSHAAKWIFLISHLTRLSDKSNLMRGHTLTVQFELWCECGHSVSTDQTLGA